MSFHVNFNTHGRDLNDALQAVISERDDTNWVIYAYDKGTYDLRVQATGDDGLEGLCDEFSDGKVQFAYAKVIDPNTELPKFVFIGWCGSGVPELRKAFFNSQLSDVSKFVKSYHVQINARDEADVEPSLIMKRVAESSGANYSVHKETNKPLPRAEPVGSSYKKTEIPDIAAMQREAMTKDNMPKPVGTNYTPIKTEPKKLSQRWNIQGEDDNSKAQAVRAEREQFEKEVREREMQRQQSTRQSDMKQEEEDKRRRQQEEEEENKRRVQQQEEEERLRREKEAQQKRQQEEEERRRQLREEEEERARREEEEQKDSLKQKQQEEEEAERRRQQEIEEEDRRRQQQQQQQQAEEERRRQQEAAEEEERKRRQQKQQEEEEQRRKRQQEEEEQRRREAEEAQRTEKERLQRQQEEEASLQSQLNETADRAVHTSQSAGAAAADPKKDQHHGISAVVLFDYDADESNEMSLIEGELITQIDQVDEGWWFGISEDGNKQGLFPANYVQLLEEGHRNNDDTAAAAQPAPSQQESQPQNQTETEQGHVAVALYDYDAEEDNEISFAEGDKITQIEFVSDDWWQGVDASGKKVGLFPANYVELKQ
ncbi:hypothetical protein BDF20DRAFT_914087 [Mycotypha africana]|uniref:uncharacterized protein n=1 Tax=Mycotypha africana TaxID=64632 RepID=UPI0023002EDF|nr:uncharacterized protein BDF20DRAFT_914087 [Mycotypha africana]KAI8975112.1 hypothetical protein BDF20DRAFT_914087 [Mycotypha africana]